MRIKDDLGESYTKADIISYEELVAVSLAGISIENGAEETAGTTVRVRFDYGGSPTHYRMAETDALDGQYHLYLQWHWQQDAVCPDKG